MLPYAWRRGGTEIEISVEYREKEGRWFVLVDGEKINANMSFHTVRYIWRYDAIEYARELKEMLLPKYDKVVFQVCEKDGSVKERKVY